MTRSTIDIDERSLPAGIDGVEIRLQHHTAARRHEAIDMSARVEHFGRAVPSRIARARSDSRLDDEFLEPVIGPCHVRIDVAFDGQELRELTMRIRTRLDEARRHD
ncbi:MAG TPA: hypothetical protein VLT59_03575, partial [Steroidobacteraceae bacterium]|nr:hypothetical protein [Steroidobacteraceae bacterium]